MNQPSQPRILITNDDGIHAPGINILAEALKQVGEVWVIAPDRERSAISHSFTMHHPIRVHHLRDRVYVIDGTPADCVMFGARGYLEEKPHLVVSGINRGPNLGIDTVYSGTVAGAHEGHLCGIPSFAISLNITKVEQSPHYETAAQFAVQLARRITQNHLPDGTFLNVNVPNLPWEEVQGVSATRLGERVYRDTIIRRTDPHGREYFWIGGEAPTWVESEGTDFHAIEEKKISVTPLGADFTQYHAIPELDRWQMHLET